MASFHEVELPPIACGHERKLGARSQTVVFEPLPKPSVGWLQILQEFASSNPRNLDLPNPVLHCYKSEGDKTAFQAPAVGANTNKSAISEVWPAD